MTPPAIPVVLVVHDDPAVLGSLGFALDVEGFAVCTFGSGAEVLALDHLPDPSCFVAHHPMPGMTGLDLLARLRARGMSMPAVLINGEPDALLRERAASVGVSLIVEKALLDDALLEAVRAALRPR